MATSWRAAEVVEFADKGVVLVRVLPGPACDHRELFPLDRTGF